MVVYFLGFAGFSASTLLSSLLDLGQADRRPLTHYSIKNFHTLCDPLSLFVGIWFQLLFHSPHRGAFHLSLTVLVHYRSLKVFSLTE